MMIILTLTRKYLDKNFQLIEEIIESFASSINSRPLMVDLVENLAVCYKRITKRTKWYTFFLNPTDEFIINNYIKLHKTLSISMIQRCLEENLKIPKSQDSNVIPLRSFKLKPLPPP